MKNVNINIIGYGYKVYTYEINTYVIIKTNNKIKYKLYKWYNFSSQKRKNEIITILQKEGYKNIEYYERQIESNVKRLVLENPIDLYSERPDKTK